MPCWLFTATQPTRKALCNWMGLQCNERTSESAITCHIWHIMSLQTWELVTWGTACIQCLLANWMEKGEPRCLGNFHAPSWTPNLWDKPELLTPPLVFRLEARSDQPYREKAANSLWAAVIFKNICSLQQMRWGLLARWWPTKRKANLSPAFPSPLYKPDKSR